MNHRVSRELVLFFSLRVVISQQRKYRLAKNLCNSHFNPFIHTIQKPILCSDRHTFSWYYPREFDTKSNNFPWLMFLSSHHLSTWKSIKILMRNPLMVDYIICHSCNFTNLRGTAVALLSFLAYAISTITVVGLKENQTNQQPQDVLLATEVHIFNQNRNRISDQKWEFQITYFLTYYLPYTCLWQLHPNFLHLSP